MQRGEIGTYESTSGGEPVCAFVPAPLPPVPALVLDGSLQRTLEAATLALGRLDAISTLRPDEALFLYAYVRKEAVLSSRIEGTQSSLSDLMLCNAGVLRQLFLYLSLYFKQHRSDYYDLLNHVRRTGDWETWLAFYLEGVRATAEGTVAASRRMVELFASDRATIERRAGRRAGSALRVHETLKARPVLSLSGVSAHTTLSFPTAATAMQLLVDQGIARELTGKPRGRLFVYDGYLAILNEGTEA